MLRLSAFRTPFGAALALGLATAGLPAQAQGNDAEVRIRALEGQVRALQRAVFPGSDGQVFEPRVDRNSSSGTQQAGAPASGAVTDILARLDTLENEIARLTAMTEESRNDYRGLETRIESLETLAADMREREAATPAPTPTPTGPATTTTTTTGSTPARTTEAQPAAPTPARVAAVAAIEKPQSDDPGEDEYNYGFRLWDAGFYPEAQQQLKLFVRDHPDHRLVSHGRNLIGRAYLDGGDADQAAAWFVENYTNDRGGARASDSLLYLAVAMIERQRTDRACIALAEFSQRFASEAVGRLETLYNQTRGRVDCD